MKANLQHFDLLDSINERHLHLRDLLEKRWKDSSDIYLSNSEWDILTRVYHDELTKISNVTKHVDISRQATHKFIKRLVEKDLIIVQKMENNKKERSIALTELGKECYEKNEALKAELETKIAENIGSERVKLFKEILKMDWEL